MNSQALAEQDDSTLWFEEGIIGVPRARRFQLLEQPGAPYRILRCLDLDGFNLPVVDPTLAEPEYGPRLSPRIASMIELAEDDPVLMLAVTSVLPTGPVVNLRAPVIVNVKRRLAAQVILENRRYPLQAPLPPTSGR